MNGIQMYATGLLIVQIACTAYSVQRKRVDGAVALGDILGTIVFNLPMTGRVFGW